MVGDVVVGMADGNPVGLSVGVADGLADEPIDEPPVGLSDGLPVAPADRLSRHDAISGLGQADWWVAGKVRAGERLANRRGI